MHLFLIKDLNHHLHEFVRSHVRGQGASCLVHRQVQQAQRQPHHFGIIRLQALFDGHRCNFCAFECYILSDLLVRLGYNLLDQLMCHLGVRLLEACGSRALNQFC